MNKLWGHFKTISIHKYNVTKLCIQCGLYKQGILHDLSKYSYIEFSSGVRFYQGDRSPIEKEKELLGYSLGWLHHKGRNKHHWEYWLDHSRHGIKPIEMPKRYVKEIFCDRVAACKVYQKDHYKNSSALEYFERGKHIILMHPNTSLLLEDYLTHLANNGLSATIQYLKQDK